MKQPETAIFMSVHMPASLKLDAINESLAFYEQTIGPVVTMKLDNDMSLFRFAATEARPKNAAKISRQVEGKPQIGSGETLVTTGRIFIEGEQVLCAATRPA